MAAVSNECMMAPYKLDSLAAIDHCTLAYCDESRAVVRASFIAINSTMQTAKSKIFCRLQRLEQSSGGMV
jgi:hypothetical protein